MKKFHKIITRFLLVVMVAFAMHDFSLGQDDIVQSSHNYYELNEVNQGATLVQEHHIFHSPMLLLSYETSVDIESLEKSIYTLENYTTKNNPLKLYTPPKLS